LYSSSQSWEGHWENKKIEKEEGYEGGAVEVGKEDMITNIDVVPVWGCSDQDIKAKKNYNESNWSWRGEIQ
jgi:hypothetical protein